MTRTPESTLFQNPGGVAQARRTNGGGGGGRKYLRLILDAEIHIEGISHPCGQCGKILSSRNLLPVTTKKIKNLMSLLYGMYCIVVESVLQAIKCDNRI